MPEISGNGQASSPVLPGKRVNPRLPGWALLALVLLGVGLELCL